MDMPLFAHVAQSEEFRVALSRCIEEPLAYADFKKLPMPRGCAHNQIWNFIMTIQRCSGHAIKIKPWFTGMEKDECWYFLTKATKRDLYDLTDLASPDAHINRFLLAPGANDSELLGDVFEEVSSLARRDGLHLSQSEIRDVWMGITAPRNDEEHTIANIAASFYALPRLVEHNHFSRMLISDIYDMVTRNVHNLEATPKRHFDTQMAMRARLDDEDYANETLDELVRMAKSAHSMQETIMTAILISDCLWDLDYVPTLRCLTEFLIRRAFFLMQRMPALSYVPFSSMDELGTRPYKNTHEQEARYNTSEGLCSSWLFAGGIKAYLESARRIHRTVQDIETRQRNLAQRLDAIPNLNARQKAFANATMRNPRRGFSIQDYMRAYRVAYGTAYYDLKDLSQRGLLEMEKKGRSFVFRGKSSDR